MSDIETRLKEIVANTIRHLTSEPSTQNIYLMWPNLITITERFCNFVSPLMPSNSGEPLASQTINFAIRAYRKETTDHLKGRAYVLGLLEAATSLSGLTVEGVKPDKIITWEPYIEPMFTWMVKHDVMIIRISRREGGDSGAAKMALLLHILTAQDIEDMGFSANFTL